MSPSETKRKQKLSFKCDNSTKSILLKRLLHKEDLNLRIKLFSVLFFSFFLALNWINIAETLKNKYGTFTVISAKPCQNALGQVGTCMFMWDCIKSEGLHLGTCSDRFLFGSCCHHNSTSDIDVDIQRPSTAPTNSTSNLNGKPQHHQMDLSALANDIKPPPVFEQQSTTTPFLQSSSTAQSESVNSIVNRSRPTTSSTPSSLIQTNSNKTTTTAGGTQMIEFDDNQSVSSTTPMKQISSFEPTTTTKTTTIIPAQNEPQAPPTSTQMVSNEDKPTPPAQQQQQTGTTNALYDQKPTPTTTANPLISEQTTNQVVGQQQQSVPVRPNQGSPSWFSRPSLLANAIFHSFKPFAYLNPNRNRPPTYRPPPPPPAPITNGIYRPMQNQQQQLYRPTMQQQQQQKPLVIPINSLDKQTFAQQQETIQDQQQVLSNSSLSMQDNNDHHVVAPMANHLTQRYRPLNTTNPLSEQQKQNQYELLGASSNSSATLDGTTASVDLNNRTSSATNQCPGCNNDYNNSSVSQATATTNMDASEQQTSPVTNLLTNENSNFQQSSGFVSMNGNHGRPTLVLSSIIATQPPATMTTTSYNQSANYPVYPLIPPPPPPPPHHQHHQSSNDINNMILFSTSSPIDEIHGLFVSPDFHEQQASSSKNYSVVATNSHSNIYDQANSTTDVTNNQHQQQTNSQPMSLSPSHQANVETLSFHSFSQQPATSMQTTTTTTTTSQHQATTLPTISSMAANSLATQAAASFSMANKTQLVTTTVPTSPDTSSGTVITTDEPKRLASNSNANTNNQQQPPHKEVACGVTALYPQTKVVGGKNAAFGAWPWQVSVRKVSFFGFSSTHRCGGAVISSEWIATAGHCVEDLALQSIRIRVGEYDFSSVSEPYPHIERAARRKVVHPKYNFYTYENDLALVQLDQPLQFPPHIAPICLPPDNIDLLGRNATVTGWGRLNEGGTLPTILQEVRVPIVSNDKCKDMFLNAGRPEYIPDIFLCAGYEEGGRDSCQGDSGGPLQVRGDDGKWFLAGIISWGIGCAEQNLPGVCTRISRFKLWIQSTMNSNG